jgi:hypothetical protein
MRRLLSTIPRMIGRALAAMLLLWCFASPAGATALDDANAAADSGDYAKAMQLLRPLAEQEFSVSPESGYCSTRSALHICARWRHFGFP